MANINLFAIILFTILAVIVLTFIVIMIVGKYKALADFSEKLQKNTNAKVGSKGSH